jgi:hypothetical protein
MMPDAPDEERTICWLSMMSGTKVRYCRPDCEAFKKMKSGGGCEFLSILRATAWNFKVLADPGSIKRKKRGV